MTVPYRRQAGVIYSYSHTKENTKEKYVLYMDLKATAEQWRACLKSEWNAWDWWKLTEENLPTKWSTSLCRCPHACTLNSCTRSYFQWTAPHCLLKSIFFTLLHFKCFKKRISSGVWWRCHWRSGVQRLTVRTYLEKTLWVPLLLGMGLLAPSSSYTHLNFSTRVVAISTGHLSWSLSNAHQYNVPANFSKPCRMILHEQRCTSAVHKKAWTGEHWSLGNFALGNDSSCRRSLACPAKLLLTKL